MESLIRYVFSHVDDITVDSMQNSNLLRITENCNQSIRQSNTGKQFT